MRQRKSEMIFHTAGGRVPLTVLRRLAELGLVHGEGKLALGSRQELILPGVASRERDHVRQGIGTLLPEHHPRRPNIVTTRAATGPTRRTPWLSEGAYDHVLESFTAAPHIAVNLVDPRQSCVPRFTGQLHVIASSEPEYWHLSFNTAPAAPPARMAGAVHSTDVAAVTRLIQQALLWSDGPELPRLQSLLEKQLGGRMRALAPSSATGEGVTRPLFDFVPHPDTGTCSLGIPVQSGALPCAFLVDLAVLARRLDMATANVTAWRSLVLHGIPGDQREAFERLLLRHRVGTYAGPWAAVCFNDFRSPPAVAAGAALLRALNASFPHCGSLQLGLVEDPLIAPDMPIVVRALSARSSSWPLRHTTRYSVDLRDGSGELVSCATDVPATALPGAVLKAIDRYCAADTRQDVAPVAREAAPAATVLAHRCVECGTEYNPLYGDPLGKIDVGTPFGELPPSWRCPTCEAPLNAFRIVRGTAA